MSSITLIFGIVVIFLITLVYVFYRIGLKLGANKKDIEWQANLQKRHREIAEKQRAGIKGKVTEAFAPFLPGFPFKASECKFIGDPIDYLVFEGLNERDIKAIHFLEVKEGVSKLSKHQKQIKDIIDKKENIDFKEFKFNPDELSDF